MNPSRAACITPNGSRRLSALWRTDRPINSPTAVAPRITAKSSRAKANVLSRKNMEGLRNAADRRRGRLLIPPDSTTMGRPSERAHHPPGMNGSSPRQARPAGLERPDSGAESAPEVRVRGGEAIAKDDHPAGRRRVARLLVPGGP